MESKGLKALKEEKQYHLCVDKNTRSSTLRVFSSVLDSIDSGSIRALEAVSSADYAMQMMLVCHALQPQILPQEPNVRCPAARIRIQPFTIYKYAVYSKRCSVQGSDSFADDYAPEGKEQ